jgi:hypothetical protein
MDSELFLSKTGEDRRFSVLYMDKRGATRLKAVLVFAPDIGLRLIFSAKSEKDMLKAMAPKGKVDYNMYAAHNNASTDPDSFIVSDPILFNAGKTINWNPSMVKALFDASSSSKKRKAEAEAEVEAPPKKKASKTALAQAQAPAPVYDFVQKYGGKNEMVSLKIKAKKLVSAFESRHGDLSQLIDACDVVDMDVSLKGGAFAH